MMGFLLPFTLTFVLKRKACKMEDHVNQGTHPNSSV